VVVVEADAAVVAVAAVDVLTAVKTPASEEPASSVTANTNIVC
jgi:hypothetical protein